VGEAEKREVLDRPFAEIVIDPKDALLVERRVQRRVERTRGREVAPEGLFQNDARAACRARGAEALDDGWKHARRDRQVVRRLPRIAEGLPKRGVRRRIAVVAIDVA